ncbi:beta-glucuronidase [Firmicutes bacterium AM55-24TS]|jgi:beta-glucuronidase|nr:beta-glucuronidase [Firmicutes bacterium AM55-24TS]
MIRLFEQHRIRESKELDGMWNFKAQGKEYQMPVPACWEQHPDFLSYRGKGEYSKRVYVKNDGNVRLEFNGVSHTADVYFDGEKIAHHYNAFTPFSAVIKNVKKGEHEIKVEVDNTFGEHSALHIPNDYYTYGGITRPVAYEQVDDVYIKNVHFTPKFQDGKWSAKIEVSIGSLSDTAINVDVKSTLAGTEMNKEVSIDADTTVVFEQEFDDVKAWSQGNSNLYMLNTVISVNDKDIDDLIERVGFRTVEVRDTKIYLNGEEIYLKGFNRHEDYAVDGCAVTLQHMVQDMDLMQDMGANAVRTCHYPNDERFLDLCDERGIFVWEENHARGLVLKDMQNPNFEKQCEDCIREMIENHYNHPSIVIWGILNECASETDEGRRMYKKQYDQIKSLDTSRPTTSATCRHFTDICLDLPDVVSFNMYTKWYKDCPIDERNNQEIEWIKESGGDNKPIIVSELGAAAIYGYRDRSRCKWSEERQADLIRDNLEVYMTDDRICGVFIWQFADCRVTEEGEWFATRARCHNNKGIVDEYRRPKMAYDTVKEMYTKYGGTK